MPEHAVGLGDLAVYIPRPRIDMETLVRHRVASEPELERRLRRAVASTGQKAFRFPDPWQDSATLAAQSLTRLLDRPLAAGAGRIRHLAVGTETTVDLSKPLASYVLGMASGVGTNLDSAIATYQIQHACAGGTVALLSVAAQLLVSAPSAIERETGVVICSDVARYRTSTTAEITQGAGAVSLLIERDPRLIELDIGTTGYASRDVDDFFRPLGSVEAKVKGAYSVQCYNEALEVAFLDHCARRQEDPARVLADTDLLVVHVPFYQMAVMAAHRLLSSHLRLTGESAEEFLACRGFFSGIEPLTSIGNIYTGSLYLALAYQLAERYATLGNAIAGRRVLLASYGSGNTMIVMSGRVSASAPSVIAGWNIEEIAGSARQASIEEYEAWIAGSCDKDRSVPARAARPAAGDFYLSGIRDDGYREYGYAD